MRARDPGGCPCQQYFIGQRTALLGATAVLSEHLVVTPQKTRYELCRVLYLPGRLFPIWLMDQRGVIGLLTGQSPPPGPSQPANFCRFFLNATEHVHEAGLGWVPGQSTDIRLGILCRDLCRNRVIPDRIGPDFSMSLAITRRTTNRS